MRRLILPLLLLSACLPAPSLPPEPADCGAAALRSLVGQPVTALAGRQNLRVIRPGQAVTMDYSASRLNAEVDGQDRITRLRCG